MRDEFDNWLMERDVEAEADDGWLLTGTIIGAFRIEHFLGKGGFAEVYSAEASNGERVAIKILHRLDEQSRVRFERESNILSQIHHPNIPKLLSFGSCGNRPYLVTEMLQAKELPHSDVGVATLVKSVCAAANALHKMGYVHRDIKPSNVLWRGDVPVLIDFGLACPRADVPRPPSAISMVDGQRIIVGTVGYAAPEQFSGGKIDEATDVHAIGMLADACFDGNPPTCWRKIIARATNSRNYGRYPSSLLLSRRVTFRHFVSNLSIITGVVALIALIGSIRYGVFNALLDADENSVEVDERTITLFQTQDVYRVVEFPAITRTQEVYHVVTVTNEVTRSMSQLVAVTNMLDAPIPSSKMGQKTDSKRGARCRDPVFDDVFGL